MKAYAIRPNMEVFDGSGVLEDDAVRAMGIIAEMVADGLRQGGDTSHRAIVWEGPIVTAGTRPRVEQLSAREDVIAFALKFLNPNGQLGGDIRSALNCRTATFGQDGQAILCLRHEDEAPASPNTQLVSVSEEPQWLAETDALDGGWPEQP